MLNDEYLLDVKAFSEESFSVSSLKAMLEQGEDALRTVQSLVNRAQTKLAQSSDISSLSWLVPVKNVQLLAPIQNPQKIVAIGQNYRDHCLEQNAPIPERPIIFTKFPTAVIGTGEGITWEPSLTSQVDFEAELAVVIGKRARCVSQTEAFDYVAGYMNANDVSARDLQFGDKQWVRGKSLDTFCPLGPYLITKDEVSDPHNLSIRSILNGEVMQDSNTDNLIFTIPFLIEFASRAFTLFPGDILLTGTPPGVGVFRDPKILLQPGDTITVEVEGLGTLTNPVVEWNYK
ncbi:fumarylacetoacetate hydrolase [candidate division KSB3 bacterium]|uniref:Fumarylacetoacetate hydrolase n=1 Tax=candidate division KSB3 bacterium TaxID=2044937 RepID=A0A2G6KGK7_9BACT|nr:MAG: fumarylacetoacetate hydrolase [candidate division KSB3 bacterium]